MGLSFVSNNPGVSTRFSVIASFWVGPYWTYLFTSIWHTWVPDSNLSKTVKTPWAGVYSFKSMFKKYDLPNPVLPMTITFFASKVS